MKIVAIGDSSFMAQAVKQKKPEGWIFLSRQDALANTNWAKSADCVINFAFSPTMRTDGYSETEDIDSQLARVIKDRDAHYIMLSSRMVYGRPDAETTWHETDPATPSNPYALAKHTIEQSLENILGNNRLTVLRLSNIFGVELGRTSFFGMMQTRLLKEGRIIYDMHAGSVRDFLSAWRFADTLIKIANAPKAGLYNLGAGFGIETGKIAEWMIEGYGTGELVVESDEKRDQFVLDMKKTHKAFDIPAVTHEDLRRDCVECGRVLKSRQEAA